MPIDSANAIRAHLVAAAELPADDQWIPAGDAVAAALEDDQVDSDERAAFAAHVASLDSEVRAFVEESVGVDLDSLELEIPTAETISALETILMEARAAAAGDPDMDVALRAVLEAMGLNTEDTTDDVVDAAEVGLFQRYAPHFDQTSREFISEQIGVNIAAGVAPAPPQYTQPPVAVGPVVGSPEAGDIAADAARLLDDLNGFRWRNFGDTRWVSAWGKAYYDQSALYEAYTDPYQQTDLWLEYALNLDPSYRGLGEMGLYMAIDESKVQLASALETVRDALDANPVRSQMRRVRSELYELRRRPHVIQEYDSWFPTFVLERSDQLHEIDRLIAEIDRLPSR